MIFQRIRSEGLAHNSYFIGSGGEAAVVDPRRDCEVYIEFAERHGLTIRYVFETHRNEDYVVGSRELKAATGAEVYHGPGLGWKYGVTLRDGQELKVGRLNVTAIHTPGHTDESMTYALVDSASGPATVMAFTGDALFVDDVGRTDLYGADQAERLALELYDSLWLRILALGDGVMLCPAHGAGSLCGASISEREESTLGVERTQNQWLQMDRDTFLRRKVEGRPERPHYFRHMEQVNLEGPPVLGGLPAPPRLAPEEFQERLSHSAVVVDTSTPTAFCGAHIPGSYSIWLEGLPEFAGWVLPYDRPLLLVLEDESRVEPAVRYLVRLGYDWIEGFLGGGIEAWYDRGLPIEGLAALSVHSLRRMLGRRGRVVVLDVRSEGEWRAGHIDGALHIYVGHLEERLADVPRDRPVAVLCNVGRRASLGASILKRAGYPRVYNVLGSMAAWYAAGYPVVAEQANI